MPCSKQGFLLLLPYHSLFSYYNLFNGSLLNFHLSLAWLLLTTLSFLLLVSSYYILSLFHLCFFYHYFIITVTFNNFNFCENSVLFLGHILVKKLVFIVYRRYDRLSNYQTFTQLSINFIVICFIICWNLYLLWFTIIICFLGLLHHFTLFGSNWKSVVVKTKEFISLFSFLW